MVRYLSSKKFKLVVALLVVVLVIFFLTLKWYGIGGSVRKSEAYASAGMDYLIQYYDKQRGFFSVQRKFDLNLHKEKIFQALERNGFEFGFKDSPNPIFKELCPDCAISESSYKIGATRELDGKRIFLTIDNNRKISVLRE